MTFYSCMYLDDPSNLRPPVLVSFFRHLQNKWQFSFSTMCFLCLLKQKRKKQNKKNQNRVQITCLVFLKLKIHKTFLFPQRRSKCSVISVFVATSVVNNDLRSWNLLFAIFCALTYLSISNPFFCYQDVCAANQLLVSNYAPNALKYLL